MNTRKAAAVSTLVATAIGTNYAMMPLYNVKLMDLIVFIGGFCFGPAVGALIGVFSWAVYGALNPIGFMLPVWLSTMSSEMIYGLAGGFLGRSPNLRDLDNAGSRVSVCFFFGALGVFLTFLYDAATNIVFGCINGWDVIFALIVGFVPFGLVHVVSNAFFFGVGSAPAIKAVLNVVGGEASGSTKK